PPLASAFLTEPSLYSRSAAFFPKLISNANRSASRIVDLPLPRIPMNALSSGEKLMTRPSSLSPSNETFFSHECSNLGGFAAIRFSLSISANFTDSKVNAPILTYMRLPLPMSSIDLQSQPSTSAGYQSPNQSFTWARLSCVVTFWKPRHRCGNRSDFPNSLIRPPASPPQRPLSAST